MTVQMLISLLVISASAFSCFGQAQEVVEKLYPSTDLLTQMKIEKEADASFQFELKYDNILIFSKSLRRVHTDAYFFREENIVVFIFRYEVISFEKGIIEVFDLKRNESNCFKLKEVFSTKEIDSFRKTFDTIFWNTWNHRVANGILFYSEPSPLKSSRNRHLMFLYDLKGNNITRVILTELKK